MTSTEEKKITFPSANTARAQESLLSWVDYYERYDLVGLLMVADFISYEYDNYYFVVKGKDGRRVLCIISRPNSKGYYCGYFDAGKREVSDETDRLAHGGLTGFFDFQGHNMIGFDCNHGGDFTLAAYDNFQLSIWLGERTSLPTEEERDKLFEELTYRNFKYVYENLLELVSSHYFEGKNDFKVSKPKPFDPATFKMPEGKSKKRRQRRARLEQASK